MTLLLLCLFVVSVSCVCGQSEPSVPPDASVIPAPCTNRSAFFPLQIGAYARPDPYSDLGNVSVLALSPASFESGQWTYSLEFWAGDRSGDGPDAFLTMWLAASAMSLPPLWESPPLESFVMVMDLPTDRWIPANWAAPHAWPGDFNPCDPDSLALGPQPNSSNATCLQVDSLIGFRGARISPRARSWCRSDRGMCLPRHAPLSGS